MKLVNAAIDQNIFGPMRHAGMVEDAMIEFLTEWLPTYLAEINRRIIVTRGVIPEPRSYSTVNDFSGWPEASLPAILVMAPNEEPINKNGNGSIDAVFRCGVGGVVEAGTQKDALRLAKLYMATVRNAVAQNSTLGKRVQQSRWISSDSDRVPAQSNRTLAGFEVVFEVVLSSVVSERYGPPSAITPPQLEPAPDPTVDPGRWPVILTGDITVKPGVPVNGKPLNLWWQA